MRYYRMSVGILVGLFVLCSCYTFTGTTLPSHLKTIRVDPVVNQTLDPILAEKLTQAIINGFQLKSNLRPVNDGGHCKLITTLKKYTHEVYNTSGSDVIDYRIDLVAHVQFVDLKKDKVLFEEENLPGFGVYSVEKGETEMQGQQAAIENLVSIILDNTISGW
ncbi:MAG: hypothetical protein HQK83_05285 [Fibrobacteria bacterium]|nr:hypothetical protein [Fibrobacteria bacterium]